MRNFILATVLLLAMACTPASAVYDEDNPTEGTVFHVTITYSVNADDEYAAIAKAATEGSIVYVDVEMLSRPM